MRVYLDDRRPKPEGFDILAKTSEECISLLKTGEVTHISLDHDLGGDDDGYKVAVWIERAVRDGLIRKPTWEVHSSNPAGRERIIMVLDDHYGD